MVSVTFFYKNFYVEKGTGQNLEGRAYTLSTKIKSWGGREAQEIGIYVYVQLIHSVAQKLTHIVITLQFFFFLKT